jgi:hypothetical protein
MRKVSYGNANQLDGYDKIEKRYGRQGQGGYKKIEKKIKVEKRKKTVRYYPGWLGEREGFVSLCCVLWCALLLCGALLVCRNVNQMKEKRKSE